MHKMKHELELLGQQFGTDKREANNHHAYLDIYQKYLDPHLRENAEVVAEIGVYTGASVKMWLAYFKKAKIYGFDWSNVFKINTPRYTLIQGNQVKRSDLARLVDAVRSVGFDTIIDDGGHTMEEQQVSLGFLFPFVNSGKLYIIEDLVTSYAKPVNPRCNWNRSNTEWTTLKILQALQAGDPFESNFMTPDEIAYLQEHAAKVSIEFGRRSEIAFIEKRG